MFVILPLGIPAVSNPVFDIPLRQFGIPVFDVPVGHAGIPVFDVPVG